MQMPTPAAMSKVTSWTLKEDQIVVDGLEAMHKAPQITKTLHEHGFKARSVHTVRSRILELRRVGQEYPTLQAYHSTLVHVPVRTRVRAPKVYEQLSDITWQDVKRESGVTISYYKFIGLMADRFGVSLQGLKGGQALLLCMFLANEVQDESFIDVNQLFDRCVTMLRKDMRVLAEAEALKPSKRKELS